MSDFDLHATPDRPRPRRRRRAAWPVGIGRAVLFSALALGIAWAAGALVGGGPPDFPAAELARARLMAGDEAPGTAPPPETAPAAGETPSGPDAQPPAEVKEVSQAELDEELKNLEKALDPARRDAGEAVADKPLPADLGVALPSDI